MSPTEGDDQILPSGFVDPLVVQSPLPFASRRDRSPAYAHHSSAQWGVAR